MNQVSIFGRDFSKVEFFDYVYEAALYANWSEPGEHFWVEYQIVLGILRTLGWEAEYWQWVADGAGINEVTEEMHRLRTARPVA